MDVVEHSAGGVGVVGGVYCATGKLPEQPGINCTEEEFTTVGAFAGTGVVIQDPGEFGS